MPLTKVSFRPGINKESTEYAAGPSWYDCDRIRFRQGRPEKIGGWEKYAAGAIKGIARSLFDWSTAAAETYLAIGTTLKYYVEIGSEYYDITPIRATNTGTATFAAGAGDFLHCR